jgi:hypothetical protein
MLAAAPPADAVSTRRIREPQEQIAMTAKRRAEADEIATAQFVERTQKIMLIAQPALVFRDHCRAIAVRANPERIAPLASTADVDGACGHAGIVFIENSAHCATSDLWLPSRFETGFAQSRAGFEPAKATVG